METNYSSNKKRLLLFFSSISLLVRSFLYPFTARAADEANGGGGTGLITNPALPEWLQGLTGVQYFQRLIPSLVGLVLVIGSFLLIFILMIGGIQWMTAGGDKAAVEQARGKVTNALVGLVILVCAISIASLIGMNPATRLLVGSVNAISAINTNFFIFKSPFIFLS